jgi:hypothetical protein
MIADGKGVSRAESSEVPTQLGFRVRYYSARTSDCPCGFVEKPGDKAGPNC